MKNFIVTLTIPKRVEKQVEMTIKSITYLIKSSIFIVRNLKKELASK